MKKLIAIAGALCLASTAQGANAASAGTIRASDPRGMVEALKSAGYEATLTKDKIGDPMIEVELGGWNSFLYFYECDEKAHDKCRSVQFSVGFDRKQPWTAEAAVAVAKKYRFASVSLDEEGDPYVTWDVITGDGIPTSVFLASVLAFTDTVRDAAEQAFKDENEAG